MCLSALHCSVPFLSPRLSLTFSADTPSGRPVLLSVVPGRFLNHPVLTAAPSSPFAWPLRFVRSQAFPPLPGVSHGYRTPGLVRPCCPRGRVHTVPGRAGGE